jgi:hypothetical protein
MSVTIGGEGGRERTHDGDEGRQFLAIILLSVYQEEEGEQKGRTGFLNWRLTSVTTARMLSSFSNISEVLTPAPIIDVIYSSYQTHS